MNFYHYSYHFVQKFEEYSNSTEFLLYKLLYSFVSTKSHQCYWVWVEVYEQDFYAVKFHLKAHRHSPNKYQLLTGLNEARPVINTCIAIMLEIASRNPSASFGFIGSNNEGEEISNTKRFRIYRTMMATYFRKETFEQFSNISKSSHVMIPRTVFAKNPDIVNVLNEKFRDLYAYFD